MKFLLESKSKISNEPEYYEYGRHGISAEQINPVALTAVRRLKGKGYQAYVVGGCLRDLLSGVDPKDFDVVTDALPQQIKEALPGSIIIGKRFQLVHFRRKKTIIEISTFRGKHKSVLKRFFLFFLLILDRRRQQYIRHNTFGTMAEDVHRRDITINALYYDPDKQIIIDHVGAMQDIQNNIARMIGNTETRFEEDPMRMIRVLRFAAKLDLQLAPDIEPAIRKMHQHIDKLPSARLFDEYLKLFCTSHGLKSYEMIKKFNLFGYFFVQTEEPLSPVDEKIILAALQNNDERITKHLFYTPAFLLSIFLWFPYRDNLQKHFTDKNEKKKNRYGYFCEKHEQTCRELFYEQKNIMLVFHKFKERINNIWGMQYNLLRCDEEHTNRVTTKKDFPISYDFLKLLAVGYPEMEVAVNFWKKFSHQKKQQHKKQEFNKAHSPLDIKEMKEMPKKRKGHSSRHSRYSSPSRLEDPAKSKEQNSSGQPEDTS